MAVLFLGWSILEGLGATLVMPSIQTLVTSNYSGADRAFAGEVVVVFLVLWTSRSIIDAPLESGERPQMDIAGSVISALGIGFFVFGVLLAGKYGWLKARQPFVIWGIEISPFGSAILLLTGRHRL